MRIARALLPILSAIVFLQRGTGRTLTMIWQKSPVLSLKLCLLSTPRCAGWAVIWKEEHQRCLAWAVPYCTASSHWWCARLLSVTGSALPYWLHILLFQSPLTSFSMPHTTSFHFHFSFLSFSYKRLWTLSGRKEAKIKWKKVAQTAA